MLSSLVNQTNPKLVKVDVAFVPHEGNPTTEQTISTFESRVAIRASEWTEFERFQLRGFVRNRQLKECDTEWLMFGDCDMVYHPSYFDLLSKLLATEHKEATYMLSSGRISNPKEMTTTMVNSTAPGIYPFAWEQADALPKRKMSNVGAGFCQLINYRTAPHEGYYVPDDHCKDWAWNKGGWNTKSDMQFRKRIAAKGGPRRALPKWFTWNAIHLNHNRDPDIKGHIVEQR